MPDIQTTRGQFLLRLATRPEEVLACQHLRYRVFYEEMKARPDVIAQTRRLDRDHYDDLCDHLVVVHAGTSPHDDPIMLDDGELIGTYRLLRQEIADANGGLYSQREFDVAPLLAAHRGLRFLELGRSCVLKPFRTKPVLELLWQGIWNYVRAHGMDVMLGCASLEGTDPEAHALALSVLADAIPQDEWRVRALPETRVEMRRLALTDGQKRRALVSLPPLIKGYLRLGCHIGDGAVIDAQFNTTDVLIILPVAAINSRYFAHFGQPNGTNG